MQPLQPEPEPTARRSVWMWVGGLVGLVLAVGMFRSTYSGGESPAAPAIQPRTGSFMVSGAVVLGDSASFTADGRGGCAGTGDYADVVEGATVVVMTMSGGVAGGELAVPQALDDGTCRFSFSAADVPTGQDDYLVMVAGQDFRQYTEAQLSGAQVSIRLD